MRNLLDKEYSAGAVSKGFWFYAFKKYNTLYKDGLSEKEIKEVQSKENILLASSESYGQRMINEVSKRFKSLSKNLINCFDNLSIENQKLINLLAIMLIDRLFFEFMYEVYREKLKFENLLLEDSDIVLFIQNKELQSKKIKSFTYQTKRRLIGTYKTYLREAGILEEGNILRKPILEFELEEAMKNGFKPFLKIYLGE